MMKTRNETINKFIRFCRLRCSIFHTIMSLNINIKNKFRIGFALEKLNWEQQNKLKIQKVLKETYLSVFNKSFNLKFIPEGERKVKVK